MAEASLLGAAHHHLVTDIEGKQAQEPLGEGFIAAAARTEEKPLGEAAERFGEAAEAALALEQGRQAYDSSKAAEREADQARIEKLEEDNAKAAAQIEELSRALEREKAASERLRSESSPEAQKFAQLSLFDPGGDGGRSETIDTLPGLFSAVSKPICEIEIQY